MDATRAELDGCGALAARPGLSAAALVLASGLDNPAYMAHWPALGHRLSAILDTLRKGQPRQPRKLVAVQAMTPKKPG
ncbi:hypothetical protein BST27_18585 [Mycobacterium intermedium]|uniref:Uncharacterized protein n=1 Tax=Mycobacterium intermedium TaxID=28445 RepID=A0A1E3SF34_MYCIE|nr:hypothetical protein [Mycobacterium intermedium]MCV6963074.1 hypothetical protein [Mycobacterium intermedium]ODR00672.1 hypothetical protein BHQ20_11815 [Mycobacterium intermedium]OPE52291.1 hypothetical protein BV508_02795 [Mycobacterium intermedium]ORB00269.1 hypothetical protein BST27_18585 [Mycobacterium intermedium]